MGEISQEDARGIVERLQADLDSGYYACISLELVHYNLAREWIARFDTPLRTLDALHLAIAFSNNLRLITADEGLAGSAEAIGVEVQLLRQDLQLKFKSASRLFTSTHKARSLSLKSQ